MTIRSLVFWPHLVAGVLAGLVILLMSVTGVFLTYERQMIAWSDREFRSVPAHTGQARLPIETLVARFSEAHPGVTPTAVTIGSAPDAPAAFAVPQRTLYADAYTGAALGEGSQTIRRVMSDLRAWHRWIAVEGPGRQRARRAATPVGCRILLEPGSQAAAGITPFRARRGDLPDEAGLHRR